mgnify:CR=1 FL=1
MKSDLSFSSTITWNNFPLPPIDGASRRAIEEAGAGILKARNEQPNLSLEDHYRPGAMTPSVRDAHRRLDILVDSAFGLAETAPTLLRRQEVLFTSYEVLTSPLLASPPNRGRRRGI